MSVQLKIWTSFGVTLIFFVVVALVGQVQMNRVHLSEQWINQTHDVLAAIETLISKLKDAETGQRGYLLTADEKYLEPYYSALDDAPKALRLLESLIADNPKQQEKVMSIDHLLNKKFSELAETIRQHKVGDSQASIALVKTNSGKEMMDSLRNLAAEMKQEENKLLALRQIELKKRELFSTWVFFIGSIGSLFIVGLIAYFTSRAISRDYHILQTVKSSLANANRDYEITIEVIPDCLIELDANGKILRVNKVGTTTLVKDASWVGQDYLTVTPKPLGEALDKGFAAVRSGTSIHRGEYPMLLSGKLQHFEISTSSKNDFEDKITGFVVIIRDITEKKNAEEKIAHLALYDQLTGLLNRRALLDQLRFIQDQSILLNQYFSLLFIDLDHFKNLNDSRGHIYGDLVLKEVAIRLKQGVREKDIIARLGGDEFVILLTHSQSRDKAMAEAKKVAAKISRLIDKPFKLPGIEYVLSCSTGITIGGGTELETPENLLKKADIAMYHMKESARGGWTFFNTSIEKEIFEHNELEQDLHRAINDNTLSLEYQPIVDRHHEVHGWEALLRWHHPNKGPIPPSDFIPIAEESQLILELGQWVLNEACKQLAIWSEDSTRSQWNLSVNVSSRQLKQANFSMQLLDTIASTGSNPHRLNLELTESMLQDDVEATIEVIEQLSKKGILFSLDDFGTGYSSLSYLRRLPTHYLKVDQSFVEDIKNNAQENTSIAQLVIHLSQALGQKVVAEGIEGQAQFNFLNDIGCDYFQGFYFAHPMKATLIDTWYFARKNLSATRGNLKVANKAGRTNTSA